MEKELLDVLTDCWALGDVKLQCAMDKLKEAMTQLKTKPTKLIVDRDTLLIGIDKDLIKSLKHTQQCL